MESFGPSSHELNHNQTNKADLPMESLSTKWTEEKHNLYLNTMEASFVSQLYKQSSRKSQLENYPTDEYKVFHNGCWQKINYRRDEHQLNRTDEASSLRRNPWIQHYNSAGKPQLATPLIVEESSQPRCETIYSKAKGAIPVESMSMSKPSQFCDSDLCNQDMFDSNEEVSDQNFTDDNFVEENASGFHNMKRLKTCG